MTHPFPAFLPGLELSRLLHEEAVRPLRDEVHPGLRHTASGGRRRPGGAGPRHAPLRRSPVGSTAPALPHPEDAARHTAALHELPRKRLPKEVEVGRPTAPSPTGSTGRRTGNTDLLTRPGARTH
ncbi:hypothetical protein [Streptomyces sp. BRB081]|uniref:hypothetical protein n=1 Tax=Streptomyces sp. BRB081 TaxID=2769544 RepID=UPI0035ABA9D1